MVNFFPRKTTSTPALARFDPRRVRWSEQAADAADQVVRLRRLGEKGIGAAFDAFDDRGRVAEGGDQDDWHLPPRLVVLDCPAQFVAGQPRHDDIGEDQVELTGAEGVEPLLAIRGHHHVEARLLEHALEEKGLSGTVFDDEQSRHLLPPQGGIPR